MVLKKWHLEPFRSEGVFPSAEGDLNSVRRRLNVIESHRAEHYFGQVFSLFRESVRPQRRIGYKSYNPIDNVFNFAYYFLRTRVHKAILRAKMEPFCGFLHTNTQAAKPALVNDLQEPFRYILDDFLLTRCRGLRKRDFVLKNDCIMRLRMGKRVYLCEYEAGDLAEGLNELFEKKVEIPRMRHGSRQSLDTLINEEAYLLAQYLRNEKPSWIPRLATI